MEKLIKSLTNAGFQEVDKDGNQVTEPAAYSSGFAGTHDEKPIVTLQRGDKKVVFEKKNHAGDAGRHITFYNGKKIESFTNTGDLPSADFVKDFVKEEVAPEAEVAAETKKSSK